MTNAHHTSPVKPRLVAMNVPRMMVHTNGNNNMINMNIANPITPIPNNISLNIYFLLIFYAVLFHTFTVK